MICTICDHPLWQNSVLKAKGYFWRDLELLCRTDRQADGQVPTLNAVKVIDLGVNWKHILCDFLLVINSNFGPICYRFRDIDA